MPDRIEFGLPRVSCDCKACTDPCRHMPSYLIPSDLKRLIPNLLSPEESLRWCEVHLLASPGATVMNRQTGETRNIPTLVLSSKSSTDHSCVFLDDKNHCTIHDNAPFGCAFFKMCVKRPEEEFLAVQGLVAIDDDWDKPNSLYRAIWEYLYNQGKVASSALERRERMKNALDQEARAKRPPSPFLKK